MKLNHPDLPKLISINLGMFSLCGRSNDPATCLIMKGNIFVQKLYQNRSSFPIVDYQCGWK